MQALVEACAAGHVGVVKLLAEAGANIHHPPQSYWEETAMDAACHAGGNSIIEFLLHLGAPLNPQRLGRFSKFKRPHVEHVAEVNTI